jgi:hypothetical protein
MAETTADVRRDIELTRERISDTLAELEHRLNVMRTARQHPWAALAVAAGAGFLLAGSRADVKAAAATATAAGGMGGKLGTLLDDVAARLIGGISTAVSERVDDWVNELRVAIAPPSSRPELPGARSSRSSRAGAGMAAAQ